ncbi:2,4-dihydroxyhept-2-ene-1,7-dioic acid aldolase [Streptomyces sp. HUCO-GS316]|uniref:aldolase/citrate lyase family protein n=1 Tax=Streptomyces sp. HUCO-GS316 TaxID=2692198 RepID=UPI00136FE825|nr:2,4-dihydroxyhept-2-ene-1,7-dioic acid aldolase [Streptomyces sp. HUCO-GS316]
MTGDELPRLGAWVKLPAPESVELLALAGLDFAVIDAEHGAIDIRTMATMIAMARGCGIAPFVRVPGTAPRDVQVPLDAGAAGLFVPQIDSVAQAHEAVRAVRFPPLGERGASTSGRAGQWGRTPLSDYLRSGNNDVRLVVQAESVTALSAIGEIGAVAGIDAVFIGPMDLAVSGQFQEGSPEMADLITAAEQSCADHCIPLGTVASGHAAELLQRRGYDFLVLGADTTILRQAAHALVNSARAATLGARR